MTGKPPTPSRYHALDGQRAAMMFLGIYMHAVMAYSPTFGAPHSYPLLLTTALDYTNTVIHVFRMPVFYAMAGFFAALLLQRYGFRRAAKNRFVRIVIPYVVCGIVIFPLMLSIVITPLAISMAVATDSGWQWAWFFISSGFLARYAHQYHLWFLEYLILLYIAAACIVAVSRSVLPSSLRADLHHLFRWIVRSCWAPLPLAALSFLALLPMNYAALDTPGFLPSVRCLFAYAIPFAFGWLLFGNDDLLDTLSRRAWFYSAIAVLACVAYFGLIISPDGRSTAIQAARAANALAMWCFIFGITGLFLRYLSGYSALRRYLCDSSYFLYLAHVPVIIAFEVLLKDVPLPPLAKIPLVLAATIALLLPLYQYAVRPTFVGAVLNGRRYPAEFAPAVAAAE
jgi:glucans biosynthesis protein C